MKVAALLLAAAISLSGCAARPAAASTPLAATPSSTPMPSPPSPTATAATAGTPTAPPTGPLPSPTATTAAPSPPLPPPTVTPAAPPAARTAPVRLGTFVGNGRIALAVDQIGFAPPEATSLPKPPSGSRYVITVLDFQDLVATPLVVDPRDLRLVDSAGGEAAPADVTIPSAIDRLRRQTIQPEHGTAGIVAFLLPEGRRAVAIVHQCAGCSAIRIELPDVP